MTASTATKKRCWSFHVAGVNRKKGSKIKVASVLSSFRERYTAVRRLALSSTTTNDAKNSGGGVGSSSSKTVCIEVQFIGPQPSQGPGALLCNLLSGSSVEARPIELRRGRENKRKRRDSGSDEGSDPEAEDSREGKFARPDVLRRRKELHEKRASLLAQDISSIHRDPLQTQDISSHRDDTATYIKVSDELEQVVPAPLTRPVYMTPLSLKGLASFPAHLSTPLKEIPPSTPPSQVSPSTPATKVLLPLLTSRTDVLPPLTRQDDAPLPGLTFRTGLLPLLTLRGDAPVASLTPRNGVPPPSSCPRNSGAPSAPTPSSITATCTTPGNGALQPPSTPQRNAVSSPPAPSNNDAPVPFDTRMHWEDVICRINAPPPSRGILGRQHSFDIGAIASATTDGGCDNLPTRGLPGRQNSLDIGAIASSCSDGDYDGDGDDATDGEMFSTTGGGSSGKESEGDNEEGRSAAVTVAQGRHHHIGNDDNASGVGIGCTPFHDPPLIFDIADELLDPPPAAGSVQQQQQQGLLSSRSFNCARGILRGTSFQYADHIGLDDSRNSYGGAMEADPHNDNFEQHLRDISGLESSVGITTGCGVDGSSAEGVHRVSSSTPALVSCGATAGRPSVVVGLVPEFQECDFEGHHLPSPSAHSTFSSTHFQVVISGFESVSHAPQDLITTAYFSVDSIQKVGRRASPIRAGANGLSHAALFYPSMQAVWPEAYSTNNVRAVEVDVTVNIRSRDGTFNHTTPNLKVIYRRDPFSCTEEGGPGGV